MPTYAEIMALVKTDGERAAVERAFEKVRQREFFSAAADERGVPFRMYQAISKSTMPNLPVGRVTCRHCGQWGERETQCQHCGAPI